MVVLATKLYVSGDARERALRGLDSMIENDLGGLDVEWTIGVRDDDFVSVTVNGADATAAQNVLRERWGEVTAHFEDGEVYVGTLEGWDDDALVLDAGEEVRIPTDELGLGPGTPEQIVERFGLVHHIPMRFEYGDPPRLADEERDRLYEWTRGPGRVNVNSSTRGEVRATANRAGHAQDVATVERLGILEQSVICREGTDPPGLLSSIGEYLRAELRCVVT